MWNRLISRKFPFTTQTQRRRMSRLWTARGSSLKLFGIYENSFSTFLVRYLGSRRAISADQYASSSRASSAVRARISSTAGVQNEPEAGFRAESNCGRTTSLRWSHLPATPSPSISAEKQDTSSRLQLEQRPNQPADRQPAESPRVLPYPILAGAGKGPSPPDRTWCVRSPPGRREAFEEFHPSSTTGLLQVVRRSSRRSDLGIVKRQARGSPPIPERTRHPRPTPDRAVCGSGARPKAECRARAQVRAEHEADRPNRAAGYGDSDMVALGRTCYNGKEFPTHDQSKLLHCKGEDHTWTSNNWPLRSRCCLWTSMAS